MLPSTTIEKAYANALYGFVPIFEPHASSSPHVTDFAPANVSKCWMPSFQFKPGQLKIRATKMPITWASAPHGSIWVGRCWEGIKVSSIYTKDPKSVKETLITSS